jgi:hypothetical protein
LTISNIIADAKSELISYTEAGLIEEISLRLHLINELKRFGGNVMEVQPHVLTINNSQGKLPENFFSLYKAVKVDPTGWCSEEETLEEALLPNTFYRIRKESSKTWDNMSHAFTDGDYTEVVEKVYISGKKVDFYYGNQQPLKLVQGYDRSKVDPKCENILIKKAPYEISIINNTLQTNFSKGFIFLWYQGLMVDEDNDIILPEDPNARLYEFLLYSAKAKVFEILWNNGDDPNTQAKLQYNLQQKEKARVEASTQARFKSVSGDNWWHGLKNKQRKRTRVYENFGLGK